MINYIESELFGLSLHLVDTQEEGEGLVLSENEVIIEDDKIPVLLKKYFFSKFKSPAFYNFTSTNGEIEENLLFQLVSEIFETPSSLHPVSQKIAKHLYNASHHPNIKAGHLLVGYVNDVLIDDELVDAICIFKSEYKHEIVEVKSSNGSYDLKSLLGILPDKIDKACVIFNTEKEEGYKLVVMDKTNLGEEARYWFNNFLNVSPRSDDYHHTKNYIQATKDFINERIKPIYEIEKADEANMLNSSLEYFNREKTFNPAAYANSVFGDDGIISDFKEYQDDYVTEKKVELSDDFNINMAAVKNQSKVFKSVLKLDKNFHVYIHGNRNMIERGKDENGRKFYKLYYEEEK